MSTQNQNFKSVTALTSSQWSFDASQKVFQYEDYWIDPESLVKLLEDFLGAKVQADECDTIVSFLNGHGIKPKTDSLDLAFSFIDKALNNALIKASAVRSQPGGSLYYPEKKITLQEGEYAGEIELGAPFMLIAEEDGKSYYPSIEWAYVLPCGREITLSQVKDSPRNRTAIRTISAGAVGIKMRTS